jgi:hypothetical protein
MIKEYPLLIAAVRDQLFGEVPRMLVLDTLNKSLVGSENKDIDMAAYIVAAEALRDAFDCVVVIVHHCGYDETHPRGHTSLAAAVDAEFEVVREAMLVTIKSITMRDGPEGFEIRSSAEIVEVGMPRADSAVAVQRGRGCGRSWQLRGQNPWASVWLGVDWATDAILECSVCPENAPVVAERSVNRNVRPCNTRYCIGCCTRTGGAKMSAVSN